MDSLLSTLRQNAPHVTARQFLAAHPGCFIQYYDDTPAKNPTKALSARSFDPGLARRKQRDQCAVAFSLQPFAERRIKDDLLCFRTMGVDVDLIAPPARATMPTTMIDQRKEVYLRTVLVSFSLKPHWIIETRHGFHMLFRVQPLREPTAIEEAQTLNHRLVQTLRGDLHAVLITQLLRVPGTLQFKVPGSPFLCRLLLDNASTIPPYSLEEIRKVLSVQGSLVAESHDVSRDGSGGTMLRWQQGLTGVAEGERNTTAASLVGKILRLLPEELWETAGWGGLREWNGRNENALPERELRSVFESISRRERARRYRDGASQFSPTSA